MSPYEDLLYDVKDRVAVIALKRPDALNAYTAAIGRSLKGAIAGADADDAVRVIVLTGAGRGFCAGADMKLLQQLAPGARVTSDAQDIQHDFGCGPDLADSEMQKSFASADFKEGVAHFVEKRPQARGLAIGDGMVHVCGLRFRLVDAK